MTKADPIAVIADKLKFPWACAELLLDVVFDYMEQSMSRGEKIKFVLHTETIPIPRLCAPDELPARVQGDLLLVGPRCSAVIAVIVGHVDRAHPGRGVYGGHRH